jgi:SOS-response transcriptional repressor LexA
MTLKYYYPEGEMIRLQPANPDYQAIIAHASNVAIQGKVILVQRQMV